jgi:hypothetical protein
MAQWQALRTKPGSGLVVPVYVCFVLCSGAFRAIFGGRAAAGLAVEMKVDQAM